MKDGVKDAAGATTGGGGRERRQGALRQGLARRLAPNGHLAIAAALKSGGITHVYSLPGNPMYAALGACVDTGLTVIGCRSQFGALSAALAHNFQAGKLCAVAICSPSPGVTNCITSLSDAKSNHWPMLLIGGVVEPSQAPAAPAEAGGDQGGAMFQSFDGARAVAPCCKAVMQLRDRDGLFAGITRALEQAQTAPCGPVFVEVGPTVLNARHHDADVALRHSKPAQPTAGMSQLDHAKRPVLILGEDLRWYSTLTPERRGALQAVLEQLQLPVLATDMARGILPDGHRLSLFLAKDEALKNCDHLVLCGADLDWRFGADSALGDQVTVAQLAPRFDDLLALLQAATPAPGRAGWAADLAQAHQRGFAKLHQQGATAREAGRMNQLCVQLARWVPEHAVTILDSGLALSSGHNFWPVQQAFSRMTPGQNGTIGLGIPFALGSALQVQDHPHGQGRPVVALVGDVGFALAASELETAQRCMARLVIVVADNGGINGRGFQDNWLAADSPDVLRYGAAVDYAKIAQGWGVRGITARSQQDLQRAMAEALNAKGPTVISVPMGQVFDGPQPKIDGVRDGD